MSVTPFIPVLFREAEAAKRLGLTRDYLYRLRAEGPRRRASDGILPPAPPHVRIGRRVMYRPADLDTWLASLANGVARVSRRRGRPSKQSEG